MQPVTRRSVDDTGAALLLTTIVLFSLLVFAALAIDTARLVQERRTLQNGADAAALALAQDCADLVCPAPRDTASQYANANADDGQAHIPAGVAGVCFLSTPAGVCTAAPTAQTRYVRVTTETGTTSESGAVPYTFGRVAGLTGQTVHRQATATWGGLSAYTGELPLTISLCEWSTYTDDGATYATYQPPGMPTPASAERVIYFHQNTDVSGCPKGPAGKNIPGGWGKLDTDPDCRTPTSTTGWYSQDTGNSTPDCDADTFEQMVGRVVHVPVFQDVRNSGNNGEYRMTGYAAFFLTGYVFKKNTYEARLAGLPPLPCNNSKTCISGFFLGDQIVSEGAGGGPSMGSTLVNLVE